MAMKTVFVLIEEHNEQDNYSSTIHGVTDRKDWAHAWGAIDRFSREPFEDKVLEVSTLNVLDAKLLARIEEYLDPKRNPLCECGHRKLHHRNMVKRGPNTHQGSCKHNIAYGGKKSPRYHQCKGFKLAAEQPETVAYAD